MKIALTKVVAIAYDLGISTLATPVEKVESVLAEKPMYFLVGHSGLPEKFEEKLFGKVKGDEFSFVLQSDEAFGKIQEEDIMNLPLDDFKDEKGELYHDALQIGKLIPMTDENGDHIRGRVFEVNHDNGFVKIDFNHPLAGKNLHFEGKIIDVRDATKEEMDHGHVHGPDGHHHH